MKANELQIGDWVQNPHGWKARVMSIKHTCVFKDEWEYLFKIGISKDTFQNNLSESDLSPIPLTPEVLEKNGFRITFDGELNMNYFQDIERFLIEVIVDKTGKYPKISIFDVLGNGVTIAECKFVHQLQQAMRICKIKREIVL